MDDLAREKLRDIVKTYGPEIGSDPRRVKGLLLDHCAQCRGEINVLIIAQQANVPHELLNGSKSMPRDGVARQLARRLEDEHFLTEEAAYWAVESWALALGMRLRKPKPRSAPATASPPAPVIDAGDPASAMPVHMGEEMRKRLGPFLKPLSQQGVSRLTVYMVALIGLVYVLNPIPGGVDIIPDIIPFVGNLDDGAAAILVWYGLVELFEGRKFRKP